MAANSSSYGDPTDWFEKMQSRYGEVEPPPDPSDREASFAWAARGLTWARRVDPDGAVRAAEAMLERSVAEGWLGHDGIAATGKPIYRSLIYNGQPDDDREQGVHGDDA